MSNSDLDIDFLGLSPRVGPGRQAKPLSAEFQRELTQADLAQPAIKTQTSPNIVKLRDTHHALARALASGMGESDAAIVTGYSLSRVSILKADPQFAELLSFYREQTSDAVADFRQRMVDVGLNALGALQEKLEEQPEEFSAGLLKDIVKDMADRTGHAPQRGPTSVTQINMGLSERMVQARIRAETARANGPSSEEPRTSPLSVPEGQSSTSIRSVGPGKVIDHE